MTTNKKHAAHPAKHSLPLAFIVWAAVLAVSFLRLSVATGGAPTEQEAFLLACAAHPAGGYVEGAAGAPLLLTLTHAGFPILRWIPVLATLILSWCVWWIGRRIAPHRPAIALWSLLAVNVLPPVTAASLVMNGAMVTAALILLSIVAGWHAALSEGRISLGSWALFGGVLAVSTLFWLPAGVLLPIAVAFRFVKEGMRGFPWRGILATIGLLALGWITPLGWNARHDWIGCSSVAGGFDPIQFGNLNFSLGLVVALGALATPFLVLLPYKKPVWRFLVIPAAILWSVGSGIYLLLPLLIPPGLPSPVGVRGLGTLAQLLLQLRGERPNPKGQPSFLIASTPGLAALLGSRISADYPERPGAPSVFVAESPSMRSSYAFWPSYPDAVAAGKPDNLYTEEKSASPFLGRNALYITTESKDELPQTITGAFSAVGLLKEQPIMISGRTQVIRIYQCEDYRSLSL
jgi:hypothetical protein